MPAAPRQVAPTPSSSGRKVIGHGAGKVILLGEHAVVYESAAIALGIDRGVVARALPAEKGELRLRVPAWNVEVGVGDDHDLARALACLADVSGGATPALDIVAEPELPPGGGLGCSAALGVAIARVLDPEADDDAIVERAMAWERVFHGNPSGIDANAAAREGCVYFRRGRPVERLRAPGALTLCIGNTGVAASTKAMVDEVAMQRVRRQTTVEKVFKAIAAIVENARLALEAGDVAGLGHLMNTNQMLLAGLLVSTSEIETMCAVAREMGALGAKLTGAGGGGSVVALVDDRDAAKRVLEAWQKEGFSGFAAQTSFDESRPRGGLV